MATRDWLGWTRPGVQVLQRNRINNGVVEGVERERKRDTETERQRGTERLIMRALAHAIMEAGKFTFAVWTS